MIKREKIQEYSLPPSTLFLALSVRQKAPLRFALPLFLAHSVSCRSGRERVRRKRTAENKTSFRALDSFRGGKKCPKFEEEEVEEPSEFRSEVSCFISVLQCSENFQTCFALRRELRCSGDVSDYCVGVPKPRESELVFQKE